MKDLLSALINTLV
jgi:hypothetical protein